MICARSIRTVGEIVRQIKISVRIEVDFIKQYCVHFEFCD